MAFVHILATGQVAFPAFYATQALANAAVAADGGSVLDLTSVPDAAEPGAWYNSTTQTFSAVPLAQSETDQLRSAVRACHDQLRAWERQLTAEGVLHPADAVAVAHDFLAWAHHGVYLMAHNHRQTGYDDWTVSQRIAAANGMAQGALDVTSPYQFFALVEADGWDDNHTPISPVLWVNVDSGDRVNLNVATTNTTVMYLDASQLPASSILGGGWIETLTV